MNFKRKALGVLLAVCLVMGLLPTSAGAVGTGKAIQLGVSAIADPTANTNSSGTYYAPNSYLYFGVNGDASKPIKWRVLDANQANDKSAGGMFLLSEYLLESDLKFDNEGASKAYQGSDAQNWNSTFVSSPSNFTFNEQSAMLGLEKGKSDFTVDLYSISWDTSSLNPSEKMFFLSTEELAYYVGNYDNAPGLEATFEGEIPGWGWWLRSPSATSSGAGIVGSNGKVLTRNVDDRQAARPALNLNTSKVLFVSAAEGGKTATGLTPVSDYSGREWKLTLLDATRNFSVTQTSFEGSPGETLLLSYSGAQSGENEYVSAMIVDSGNNVLYYGRLVNTRASEGAASFTIPADLSAGSYTLKVFSEQCNGDQKTDYASAFVSIPLTVAHTYAATLDAADLTGAAATLDKTFGIVSSDTVTVTIIPESGKVFDTPPTVTAAGANAGAVTAGANGSYTCQITGFTADAIIRVIGSAVTPIIPTYTASLNVTRLTGAAATLSKTSGIVSSDTVTVTITPEAGKAFDMPPTVTAAGAAVGTVTAGANGSYTCQITGFTANATIRVSGSAETPVVPVLPQTGDNSHVALWGAMLIASMLGMVMILRRRGMKTE